jgi:hypothetical protein
MYTIHNSNELFEYTLVTNSNNKCVREEIRAILIIPWTALLLCELGSSVSIVFGYGLDDRAIEIRSPSEAKGFFL